MINESATMVREVAKGLGERGHILKCVAEPNIEDAPEITITSKNIILIYFYFSSAHLYFTNFAGDPWQPRGVFKYCDPAFPGNLYKSVEELTSE